MPCEPLKEIEEDNVPASVELTLLHDILKAQNFDEDVLKGIILSINHLTNINK